jgi:hypothetical protein
MEWPSTGFALLVSLRKGAQSRHGASYHSEVPEVHTPYRDEQGVGSSLGHKLLYRESGGAYSVAP